MGRLMSLAVVRCPAGIALPGPQRRLDFRNGMIDAAAGEPEPDSDLFNKAYRRGYALGRRLAVQVLVQRPPRPARARFFNLGGGR
jgi:hypothetical protein